MVKVGLYSVKWLNFRISEKFPSYKFDDIFAQTVCRRKVWKT